MPTPPLTQAQRDANARAAAKATRATNAATDRAAAEGDAAAAARDAAKARGEDVVEPLPEIDKPKREDFADGLGGQSEYAAAVREWDKKRRSVTTPRAKAIEKKLKEPAPEPTPTPTPTPTPEPKK